MRNNKILLTILAVIAVVAMILVGKYNTLVNMDEDVKGKWAQVEVQYQRRADLIPNLVETVRGYATHEQETLEKITALRSGYENAKTPEDYAKLDSELQTLVNVVVEAYPELQANENFLALQDELAGTENRIAVARKDYNESVTKYNKYIRSFPNNILAGMFGFETRDLFEATSSDAPVVEF
jgi:LemA protein